mgnify:CR=1 FL=1
MVRLNSHGNTYDCSKLEQFEELNLLDVLLDSSHDHIFYKDKESRFIRVNKQAAWALGADSPGDVVGKSDFDYFPDIAEKTRADEIKIMETGKPQLNEKISLVFSDGEKHWVSISKVPFHDNEGNVAGIVGISRDITCEKKQEEKVQRRNDFLQRLLDTSPNCVYVKDSQGRYLLANKTIADLYQTNPENMIGKTDVDFADQAVLKPVEADYFIDIDKKAIETQQTQVVPCEPFTWDDGTIHYFFTTKTPISYQGNPDCVMGISVDITDAVKFEKAHMQCESKYQNYIENAPNGVFITDENGNYIEVNDAATKITGYSEEELLSMSILDITADDFEDAAVSHFQTLIEKGFFSGDLCFIHKNGQRRWWRVDAVKLSNNRLMGFAHDITNKKMMEEELRDSEIRLKNAEKTARIGHVEWNCVEQKIYWSDVIFDLFERDSALGEPSYEEILDVYYPEDAQRLKEAVDCAIHHGESFSLDLKLLLPSGKIAFHHLIGKPFVDEVGRVVKITSTVQDVTAWKKTEMKLQNSERKYRAIVQHANDGIALLDSVGVIIDVNQRAEDIFGGSKVDLIGRKFTQISIIPDKDLPMVKSQFNSFLQGKSKPRDFWLTNRRGKRVCIEGTGSVFENESHEKRIIVIVRDKTEKKKIEEEMKQKNTFLNTIMDESPFAMWVSDADGTAIRTNKSLCRILNLSENQIVGKYNVFNDQNLKEQGVMPLIERVYHEKIPQRFIIHWQASKAEGVNFEGGNDVWIDVTLFPILSNNQQLKNVVCQWVDITEKKKTEKDLLEREYTFRTIFQQTPILTGLLNTDGILVEANGTSLGMIGKKEEDVIEKPFWDLPWWSHDSEMQKWLRHAIQRAAQGEQMKREVTHLDVNGEVHYIRFSLNPIIDDAGNIISILPIGHDITDLKEAERVLKESEEKYRNIVDMAPDGIVTIDMKGVITSVNPAFLSLSGFSKEEIEGKHFTKLPTIFKSDIKTYAPVFKTLLLGGTSKTINFKWKKKNGELRLGQAKMCVMKTEGKRKAIQGIVRDTTEEKRAEEELKRAHKKLQEVNKNLEEIVDERTERIQELLKQKDDFINQMGHDLKNPLGPFIQLLPILRNHVSSDRHKEMIDVLNRNAWYMKNLVNKTIELAKLNSSKIEFNFEQVNLSELVVDVVNVNVTMFDERNITVENLVPSDLSVNIDKLRIEEVFSNLFNNAVKYTKRSGKIIVDAKQQDNEIVVSIKDNGIGISEDQLNQLFNEYYKADTSRHDFDSSGLGLPICKRIIEKHGGRIWAESDGLGKGSTFYFTLPTPIEKQE